MYCGNYPNGVKPFKAYEAIQFFLNNMLPTGIVDARFIHVV
jgi:hypothetical protein